MFCLACAFTLPLLNPPRHENMSSPPVLFETTQSDVDPEFFPRVRMNSHYVMDYFHASYGNFRRKNPELLIGRPNETIPEGTIEHGIRTGLNYAFLPVREYMYSIITEFFERFDIDGLELDFMRHPAFFRIREVGNKNGDPVIPLGSPKAACST